MLMRLIFDIFNKVTSSAFANTLDDKYFLSHLGSKGIWNVDHVDRNIPKETIHLFSETTMMVHISKTNSYCRHTTDAPDI